MPEATGSFSLTAAATAAVLDPVQDGLAALWRAHPEVPAADRVRFEAGLVEILANIVEHAYRHDGSSPADGTRELTVNVAVTDQALSAELEDNGRPVEIDLSAVALPDPSAESGRGLAMAVAYLDHLEHRRVGGRNTWLLRCDLAAASG